MSSLLNRLKQISRFQLVLSSCFLVCLIGCILQIIFLNQDFFELKIISVRETENLKEEDIPGFTICHEKLDLLLDKETICANLTREQCIEKSFIDTPISVQHLRTYSPIQYVKECWVPVNLSDKVDCSRVMKITPTITFNEKCFTFHRPSDYESLEAVKFKRSRPLIIVLNREIFGDSKAKDKYNNWKKSWKLSIAFHPLNAPIQYLDLTWTTLRPDMYSTTDLTYNVELTQQINFWLKYKCTDYSQMDSKSKANCYNLCFVNKCRKLRNEWPSQVPGMMDNYLNITEFDLKRSVLEECEKECGDDKEDNLECESYSYQSNIVNEQLSDLDDLKLFTIKIYPPKYVVIYKSKFQTDITHYLCFIASCIALWLGISVASMMARFLEYKFNSLKKLLF